MAASPFAEIGRRFTDSKIRRFAIVAPDYYPRTCGVGDHSARLATELRRRGHEVAIHARGAITPHPEAPDVQIHPAAGATPVAIAWRVAAAIRAQQPTDVILQYTAHMWDAWRFGSPALPWLARAARQSGARVTFLAHEMFLPWRSRPDLLAAAATTRLQFMALARIAHHTFVTTASRIRYTVACCRLAGVPLPRVVRIGPNALPVLPDRAVARRGPPTVGVFSTAAKRFDVVLDAFAQVARAIDGARMVLIGDLGPRDAPHVRAVLDRVAQHPARDRIRLTGKLPLTEVAREVSELDVYLFPMETGANTRSGTLPVALGSGLPVIATSGIETDTDLFRDGENVLIAPALEGAAFGAATLRALRDPALAARVGQGARRLYDQHLRWDRITDDLLEHIS